MKSEMEFEKFREFIQVEYEMGEMKNINYHSARTLTGKNRGVYYLYYNTILREEGEETSASLIIRLNNPRGAFEIWGFDIKKNPLSEVYR